MNAVLILETASLLFAKGVNVAHVLLPLIEQIRASGESDEALDAVYEKLKSEAGFIDDYLRRTPPD